MLCAAARGGEAVGGKADKVRGCGLEWVLGRRSAPLSEGSGFWTPSWGEGVLC
jgi:hypothetical protein